MARADIPYDFEDFGMSAQELQDKYGRQHPTYTNLLYNVMIEAAIDPEGQPSYWNWVVKRIKEDDDAIPSNDAQGKPLPEVVRMDNVDLFAAHLVAWHSRKMAILEHMLKITAGTELTVNIEGDEQKVILQGDALVAFRGGLTTALTELGTLPFTSIPMDEAPDLSLVPANQEVKGEPDAAGG